MRSELPISSIFRPSCVARPTNADDREDDRGRRPHGEVGSGADVDVFLLAAFLGRLLLLADAFRPGGGLVFLVGGVLKKRRELGLPRSRSSSCSIQTDHSLPAEPFLDHVVDVLREQVIAEAFGVLAAGNGSDHPHR
jgi:hypothetical protein